MRAIDFGTSSTAAAHRIDGGVAELVTFHGNYAFPSCVATYEGDLVCGGEAEGILPGDPAAGTRVPKLILAEKNGVAYLGGRRVPVEEIIAPILREADGGDVASVPGPRILTHPANWEPQSVHCAALLNAARRAGLDDVELISEPEAVAWHLAERLAEGTTFAVFDLGGGTCDIAALERVPDGFELLARPRAETIGGELVNALLMDLVLERLDELDDETADALRAAQRLRDSARAAKIDTVDLNWLRCLIGVEWQIRLAKTRPSPRLRMPDPAKGTVEVTRAELSQRMRPHLERAAAALGAVLKEASLDPATTPVMLSGAASVMPDVAQTLQDKCGVTVTPVKPAKGAVALGALAALEARRAPRRPQRTEKAARTPAESKERARRSHDNVTELVRDDAWEDAPKGPRERLRAALLNPSETEEFAFFTTDVGFTLGSAKATVALVITTDRVMWAGRTASGPDVSGQLRFADATDVAPLTSEADGLIGMRIQASGKWAGFALGLQDDDDILGWIAYVAQRLPTGASRDGGVLLAKLRKLLDAPVYLPASLLHAVVTAEAPEEIVWLQKCLDGETFLLTTSERLVWTRGVSSAASQARLVDLDNVQTLRNPEEGLNAFRIVVKGETHDFRLGRVHTNGIYIVKQRGEVPNTWLTNVAKLYEYPAWTDVDAAARNWIENAVAGGEDEEVLEFAHCRYEDFGSWGRIDGANTTALLLTTKRVMWARVGSVTGLGFGAAPVEWVTKVEGGNDHLTLTIGSVATGSYTPTPNIFGRAHQAPLAGSKHGFWWEPATGMVKQLRQLHAESRGR